MLENLLLQSEKYGTAWTDHELDLIIADYFSMLGKDLAGEPYIKSRRSAALMSLIGRSHRSVEFKHQNISAVLEELGLPWIPGYKPKRITRTLFSTRLIGIFPEIKQYSP